MMLYTLKSETRGGYVKYKINSWACKISRNSAHPMCIKFGKNVGRIPCEKELTLWWTFTFGVSGVLFITTPCKSPESVDDQQKSNILNPETNLEQLFQRLIPSKKGPGRGTWICPQTSLDVYNK